MRNAETVLSIIRERGRLGLPLERVYRHLFNRDLFLLAYGRIAQNTGAMTPGSTAEVADAMSLAKIDTIIEALRFERYQWTPVRRTYIEKKHSTKKRPLGIPTWSDKLVQEVIRLILDAYYEPQFSDCSHGFRPERGCHTALREVYRKWNGTAWFIEGDIAQYFDKLDHSILIEILSEKLQDGRFLRLISELLRAGYLENWRFNKTLSGVPQGGIVSPVLANLYLDRFDKWVEKQLLPTHNRGARRKPNIEQRTLRDQARYLRRKGRYQQATHLRKTAQRMPSVDPQDSEYRRLRYVRYADDFLLGFAGPRSEVEAIKQQVAEFLRETLKLDLSDEKTLLTHARTGAARFLGYEVHVHQDDTARMPSGRRSLNGAIGLRVPADVVRNKCRPYMKAGSPIHRTEKLKNSVLTTLEEYQAEYRGIVNYYRLAYNLHRFNQLKWVMETSLTKTLASKLRTSVSKVYRRFGTTLQTPNGSYKGLQVKVPRPGKTPLVGTWGGIALKRDLEFQIKEEPTRIWNRRTELEGRLLANTCELCGSHENIEVHHIHALKDLQKMGRAPKPQWVEYLAARQRKTLIVCHHCHVDIQHGRPPRQHPNHERRTKEDSDSVVG
jgi:group II intron reverse transcriptase/maturase